MLLKKGLTGMLVHAAATHTFMFCGQTRLQAPQFFVSLVRSVSQPFLELPLQSANPTVHMVSWQAPLMHSLLACGTAVQTLPQTPQFFGSRSVGVSQPFLTSPSQSSKPKLHVET